MTLKVFDLQCEQGHVFEGWFGSLDSYEQQREQGLLSCPVCNSQRVNKMLSAPRLNLGHAASSEPTLAAQAQPGKARPVAAPGNAELAALQASVMRHLREMVRHADDVGSRFAQEARKIHSGEQEARPIRGVATAEECEALADDGIAVMPIPGFLDDDRLQ